MAVRTLVRHWLSNDSRCSFELPDQLAGLSVYRLEPTFHRAVEHKIAGSSGGAAPNGKVLLDGPSLSRVLYIPGAHFAAIASGARLHFHFGAHVGRTCD